MEQKDKKIELERLKQKSKERAKNVAKTEKFERKMHAVAIIGLAIMILYSFLFVP